MEAFSEGFGNRLVYLVTDLDKGDLSSRLKSCCPEPGSCCPKFIVMSPEIHLKKSNILRANVSNDQTNSKNRGKPQKIDFAQTL